MPFPSMLIDRKSLPEGQQTTGAVVFHRKDVNGERALKSEDVHRLPVRFIGRWQRILRKILLKLLLVRFLHHL